MPCSRGSDQFLPIPYRAKQLPFGGSAGHIPATHHCRTPGMPLLSELDIPTGLEFLRVLGSKYCYIDTAALHPLENVSDLPPLSLHWLLFVLIVSEERGCCDAHTIGQKFCHVHKLPSLDSFDKLSGDWRQAGPDG